MNPPDGRCADTQQTLPELALGIADGDERARALNHVAACGACRHELDELSAVTDALVSLAPEHEPPPGFEARVLDRLSTRRAPAPRQRRRLRRLAFAGTALAGAAAATVALVLATAPDRRLAAQYRDALDGAHGQYFQSAGLLAADGTRAGTVFAYQGSPSWLFYVLDSRYRSGGYREQLVTRSGRTVGLPPFRLVSATWGVAIPVPVRDVAAVRLSRTTGGGPLVAELPIVQR
jgi:anti-sigma-K factor RskA